MTLTRNLDIFIFEYISQLLLDHNCSVLILKMLSTWFQNTSVNAAKQVDAWSDPAVASPGPIMGATFLKERHEPQQLK